jgi:hypothetical protein
MKFRIFLVLCFTLSVFILLFASGKDNDIIGKWDSVDSNSPKLIRIEFGPDSVFTLTNFLVADYQYKIVGNLLISKLEKEYPQKMVIIDTSYLVIKKDRIIRSYNRLGWKDTVTMVRDKSYKLDPEKSGNPIVGKWKWAYPMGDTATSVFYPDGRWHFSYPQDIYKGVYKVNHDTLSISMKADSKEQLKTFKVEGKLLELKDLETGNDFLYRKVEE